MAFSLDGDDPQARVLEAMNSRHIRVGVMGNVDAGKTTLIGTLVSSTLDNGRGSCRSNIMKHKHEKETGRTSTISQHTIGFDMDGNCSGGRDSEIARCSFKVVTLMDLAGHEKYFKTTVAGLSMGMADYALVLVNSAQPPTHMTMHHLRLCHACGIPIVMVMTKADACPSQVSQQTKKEVMNGLRASDTGKRPYVLKNEKDVESVKEKTHFLVPLVTVSSVTGEGLKVLKKLLYALPKRRHHQNKKERPFEFLVEEVFNINGIGTVISGFVNTGEYCKGEPLYVGPTPNGEYVKATVRSIQVARTNVDRVYAGHSACFALSLLSKTQRGMLAKGMVALKELLNFAAIKTFKAEICMLRGEPVTVVKGKYRATTHILHVKRSAKVIDIEHCHPANGFLGSHRGRVGDESVSVLRQGDQALVTFRFHGGPSYVRKGMRIILRDGPIRGIGIIVETFSS